MITQMKRENGKETRDPLTERVIGCCFKGHRELGPGFPEKVYQSALALSLVKEGLVVDRERRFRISFDGIVVGEFRLDLVIENRVVLEVKAVTGALPAVFRSQVLAYLKAAELPVGLLVNFGNVSCQIKRVSI